MNWDQFSNNLNGLLSGLLITDDAGASLPVTDGFRELGRMTKELNSGRGTLFLIGNGASASIASHIAADMGKNAHVRTEVFTDLAQITALANDFCYEQVFAKPLQMKMRRGDMLAAISSSGRSPNILQAANEARRLGGNVVTFSAMERDNPLRSTGRLNFYVPADTYGMAEICHTAISHFWIDLMLLESEYSRRAVNNSG